MAPSGTCPFELVLKITPFKVKLIYLITLLLRKSFFLRPNRGEKKNKTKTKRAFRFLEVAAGNGSRKTVNMCKKIL